MQTNAIVLPKNHRVPTKNMIINGDELIINILEDTSFGEVRVIVYEYWKIRGLKFNKLMISESDLLDRIDKLNGFLDALEHQMSVNKSLRLHNLNTHLIDKKNNLELEINNMKFAIGIMQKGINYEV